MGQIVYQRRDASTLNIIWSGHITTGDVEALTAQLEPLLKAQPARFIVGDTTAVVGFDAGARAAAAQLVAMLATAGLERIVAISPSVLIRLVCTTAALMGGVRLDLFETSMAAEAHLQKLLARPGRGRLRRADDRVSD